MWDLSIAVSRRGLVRLASYAAGLDDQGIDVGGPRRGDELVGLLRRPDPFVKRVDPEGPQLRRVPGRKHGGSGEHEEQREDDASWHHRLR
jgi:hypothetical protein